MKWFSNKKPKQSVVYTGLCLVLLTGCQSAPPPQHIRLMPQDMGNGYQYHENMQVPVEPYDLTGQPQMIPYECSPTPTIKMEFPPIESVYKTNNLWRKVGSAEPAYGKPIYIYGTVTDKKCVPLPNVTVEIWQADSEGMVAINADGTPMVDFVGDSGLKPDKYFPGTGTAYTDNMGRFSFITVFPGALGENIPHLKVRVSHSELGTFTTKMFFATTKNNAIDPDYDALDAKKRKLVMAVTDPTGMTPKKDATTYYYNITMKKKAKYRRY